MAWAEEHPKGSGRYRGCYRDRQGKVRYVPGTFDRAEAHRKAGAKEDQVRNSPRHQKAVIARAERVTFGEWVAEHREKRDVEAGTAKRDKSKIDKHLLPYWGDWRMHDIMRDDVIEWIEALRVTRSTSGPTRGQRLAPGTIGQIYLMFSAFMKAAIVGTPKLPYTPCVQIELPTIPPPDEYFLTRDEVARIVKNAPDDLTRMFVELAVGTGMRYSELMGLHRRRIDLVGRQVTVHETLDARVREIKGYPKSRRKRGLPLSDELAGKLADYMDKYPAVRCEMPHRTPGGDFAACTQSLLFVGKGGAACCRTHFHGQRWRVAVEAAGLGATPRIHDLRHTYASWLIQGGHTLDEVCDLLGHSSVLVTHRYAHLGGAHWARTRAVFDGTPQGGTPTPPAAPAAERETASTVAGDGTDPAAPNLPPTDDRETGANVIQFRPRPRSA